jgi:hypothetical protein
MNSHQIKFNDEIVVVIISSEIRRRCREKTRAKIELKTLNDDDDDDEEKNRIKVNFLISFNFLQKVLDFDVIK